MKILVVGDVEGNISKLFTKVSALSKKVGPLEMLFCVGSFFSLTESCAKEWKEFREGKRKVPIPTFILGPSDMETAEFYSDVHGSGGELCENLTYLGFHGIYKTSSNLTIAYLSGISRGERSGVKSVSHLYSKRDIEALISESSKPGFKGVDIFVTHDWSKAVWRYSVEPETLDLKAVGSLDISYVAHHLKPRYHFCGLHKRFYERTPYKNLNSSFTKDPLHSTRFIALANYTSQEKANKGIYAFNIQPMDFIQNVDLQKPEIATENPFTELFNEEVKQRDQESEQVFFDLSGSRKRNNSEENAKPKSKQVKRLKDLPPGVCWFCLSNPNLEKQLIVSVGDHSYLALPKGGMVAEHVLILPIGHYSSFVKLPSEVLEEMNKYKICLRDYFNSKNEDCIIFERNYKTQHLQLQVIPTPKNITQQARLEFLQTGPSHGLNFIEVPDNCRIDQIVKPDRAYLFIEFSEGPPLFSTVKSSIPLDYAREVLGSPNVMNLPHRVSWKECVASSEDESELSRMFRAGFKPFDFNET